VSGSRLMPDGRAPCESEDYDGTAPLRLKLDEAGSVVVYLPDFGLPDASIADLQAALAASEQASASSPPPEDCSTHSGSGRRQWFAEFPERALGWIGPRRWRRASWALSGDEQLRPVRAIRAAVEAAIADLGDAKLCEAYNSVLVNRYYDGLASIKWHADDEKWYYCSAAKDNSDIKIASVSFGAERWFEFRSDPRVTQQVEQRRKVRIRLRSGSLLLMAGATQQRWQHALPKDESVSCARYNLTFRRVMTAEEDVEGSS